MTTLPSRPPFIDTDVMVRLLTGDDLIKQERARGLFRRIEAGEVTVIAPVTVIADCLYVLTSPHLDYHLPKPEAVGLLLPILHLPHFRVINKRLVLRALDLYVAANVDFGDAYVVATMEKLGSRAIYSYDTHYDRVKGIARKEP